MTKRRVTQKESRVERRRRPSSEERRTQIIEVTLNLVATHGVRGTTLSRIAEAVGITHPALYTHFANRRELFLAALDVLFDRIRKVHQASTQEDALERLREISMYHTKLVASAEDGFLFPLFEFLAASPEEGLREALGVRQRALAKELADIVREGQQQGTIRADADADAEQIGWLITSRHWTEDVAVLMGVTEDWDAARSNRLLDLIIGSIAVAGTATPNAAPEREGTWA